MEQSEKEKLVEEIRAIVRDETAPILDILMDYLDVQFEILDERIHHLGSGVAEVLEALGDVIKK